MQNWLNLHTVYTHGNDVIAAYANQRDGDGQTLGGSGTSNADRTQWAQGNQPGQDDLEQAVGDYETRVYFGENSPDYSVVGKSSEDASDVELDLQRGGETDTHQDDATTATAACRSARRSASCSTPSSSAARTSCSRAGSTRTPR